MKYFVISSYWFLWILRRCAFTITHAMPDYMMYLPCDSSPAPLVFCHKLNSIRVLYVLWSIVRNSVNHFLLHINFQPDKDYFVGTFFSGNHFNSEPSEWSELRQAKQIQLQSTETVPLDRNRFGYIRANTWCVVPSIMIFLATVDVTFGFVALQVAKVYSRTLCTHSGAVQDYFVTCLQARGS